MTVLVRFTAVLLVLLSLPAQLRAAALETVGHARPTITVLTQNQYFGADLAPLLTAPPEEFNDALLDVLEQMAATDFAARARRQAEAIARRRPDLVGLQEVLALACIDALPSPPAGGGCDHPLITATALDFLGVTLAQLRALGAHYEAVAAVENLDTRGLVVTFGDGSEVELPGLPLEIDGVPVFITSVDRDVILAHRTTVQRAAPVDSRRQSAAGRAMAATIASSCDFNCQLREVCSHCRSSAASLRWTRRSGASATVSSTPTSRCASRHRMIRSRASFRRPRPPS